MQWCWNMCRWLNCQGQLSVVRSHCGITLPETGCRISSWSRPTNAEAVLSEVEVIWSCASYHVCHVSVQCSAGIRQDEGIPIITSMYVVNRLVTTLLVKP